MDSPFVKLGKRMAQTHTDLPSSSESGVESELLSVTSLEELSQRYQTRLEEQLVSLNNKLVELEINISELEQKNNVLSILLDAKFGKRVNHKMQTLNTEKMVLNEKTITHLRIKKEELIKTIKQTIAYKKEASTKFQNPDTYPNSSS
uniref:Uncharacterized protein n=1 Tax=viral metagenome TaxID=1070528 RepID=A0A6C0E236_9ZZZZ